MRTKLTFTSLAFATLILVTGYTLSRNSTAAAVTEDNVNPHYNGGSSFNLSGAGPNVTRCGAFPENVELSFTGSGIDTEGGFNTAVFSACTNTATNEVFDLKATDTYAGVRRFSLHRRRFVCTNSNPAICAAANAHGVPSASPAAQGA